MTDHILIYSNIGDAGDGISFRVTCKECDLDIDGYFHNEHILKSHKADMHCENMD